MRRDPKTQDHPRAVYLIGLFVVLMALFVLAGVINHLGFSKHGPGLLRPMVAKWQEPESEIVKRFQEHKKAEAHRRFHHYVEEPRLPEALRPTCYICHSDLPHAKTEKIRAMLNMHTNFAACETCHLEIGEEETVVYKWYSPVQERLQGPFYGTAYDPETGELIKGENPHAKIAPFYRRGDRLESTIHTQKADLAREFMEIRDRLTPEQREGMTKKFHVDIRPKGPECHTCHSEESILDFGELWFTEERTVELKNLSIKGLITKYDEFYIPDLFEQPEITGSEGSPQK